MITAKLISGFDIIPSILGTAHLVESGANDAERGSFPVRLKCDFDENANVVELLSFRCDNLEEFVVRASELLDRLDRVLLKQQMRAANGAPA
jgi:hypothetical protein